MAIDTTQNPNDIDAMPLVVKPLVLRHAEDAAFYWMQRSTNGHSSLLRFDRLVHFDRLLTAHLDGLRIAGDYGWECALKNLQRWKGAGEAFAAYVLAIEAGDKMRLQALWEVVERNLDVMQAGLVSALAWVKEDIAVSWMDYWLPLVDYPKLQQIALEAFAVRRLQPDIDVATYFESSDAGVRAAVCKLAGWTRMTKHRQLLQVALKDVAPEVREAASIALALNGHSEQALPDLIEVSLYWNGVAEQSKGWTKSEAIKRAEMLARHIGHALPVAHPGIPELLDRIPPRQGLLVLAHHGDPAVVPMIINAMGHKDVARLAGWAFGMITGVDLDQQRLSAQAQQDDEEEDERTTPLHDPDIGLPWPYPDYVKGWWREHGPSYTCGVRLLSGQRTTDREHCVRLLLRGTQALRWAASIHLAASSSDIRYVATNASTRIQRDEMGSLSRQH